MAGIWELAGMQQALGKVCSMQECRRLWERFAPRRDDAAGCGEGLLCGCGFKITHTVPGLWLSRDGRAAP